jgi:hypothetical protein
VCAESCDSHFSTAAQLTVIFFLIIGGCCLVLFQDVANKARRAQAGQRADAGFASLESAGELQPEIPGGEGERGAQDRASAAEAQYHAELAKELRLAAEEEEEGKKEAEAEPEASHPFELFFAVTLIH